MTARDRRLAQARAGTVDAHAGGEDLGGRARRALLGRVAGTERHGQRQPARPVGRDATRRVAVVAVEGGRARCAGGIGRRRAHGRRAAARQGEAARRCALDATELTGRPIDRHVPPPLGVVGGVALEVDRGGRRSVRGEVVQQRPDDLAQVALPVGPGVGPGAVVVVADRDAAADELLVEERRQLVDARPRWPCRRGWARRCPAGPASRCRCTRTGSSRAGCRRASRGRGRRS